MSAAGLSEPGDLESAIRRAAATGELLDVGRWDGEGVDPRVLQDVLTGDSAAAPRAVRLQRARIMGSLDLEATTLRCPLRLEDCQFTAPITLREATAPSIRLLRCTLTSLIADQLQTSGDLDLSRSIVDAGVSIRGARIGGELRFDGAKLASPAKRALDADDVRVERGAFFHDFEAAGGVYLARAHVGGQLNLDGASLTSGRAIGSRKDLSSALRADRIDVGEGMFCRDGFSTVGELRLPRAHVRGQLSLRKADLSNPWGKALYAHGLRVDHSVRCQPFRASGSDKEGAIFLLGAEIGGQLILTGSTLHNARGPALAARRMRVELDALCNKGFTAEGNVVLVGARVGGDLRFDGATLKSASQLALNLEAVNVGALDLRFAEMPVGTVKLTDAVVRRLRDKPFPAPGRWPRCQLDGCRYDTLEAPPGLKPAQRVKDRLEWLKRDPDHYAPRPYEQLAAVYRTHGDEAGARRVAIEKQRRRRDDMNLPGKLWSWFLEVTVGHGYRPWLAGAWLLMLLAIGAILFGAVFEHGTSQDLTPAETGSMPSFESVIYTADALIPVLNLEQEAAWDAHGAALWTTAALTVTGWLLTTALLAGFAVRRQ